MNVIKEALELEDTVKSYEQRDATGWKYISTFRDERTGSFGIFLDIIEFVWRCLLRKELEKLLAVTLGCISIAILLAEATILPSGVHLSLFSLLINVVGKREVLVQVTAFVPLMYMCICTYYSLFKIGMLMFYSLTPRQTSSVSLLMICSMVARYAPPISYNFLNLIHLDGNKKTIFEKRMGNIDDAVPFFGRGFNKIYPLIMVIYTIIIASNFFDRVVNYVGNWRIFKLHDEIEFTDGFDPSGLIILRKERKWLQKGYNIGEQVIPLARVFNDATLEDEDKTEDTVNDKFVENQAINMLEEDDETAELIPFNEGRGMSTRDFGNKRNAASNKYSIYEGAFLDSLEEGKAKQVLSEQASRLASRWESMKNGFQNFKAKVEAKKFNLSLQIQEGMNTNTLSDSSSHQSLDEIFERLKSPSRQ